MSVFHAAPALPNLKVTSVPQNLIPVVEQNGVSDVTADLEKCHTISRTHSPYNSPIQPVKNQIGDGT